MIQLFQIAAAAAFGAIVGSFLNVCIYRLPRQESIVWPASACPHCRRLLSWYENVPVVSYLVLRARCRTCKGPISIRYPIIEALTATMFALAWWYYGPGPLLASRLVFGTALIVLFAIDLEHHLLPDVITLPGIVAGLLCSTMLPPGIVAALVGMLIGGGVLWLIGEAYFRYSGQEGMGGGDVKMLAMIGAFLGWKLVLVTLVLSSVAGSLIGVLVIMLKRGGMKYALPYGTFLALGALAASLAGDRLVHWYLGFY
jgi:leader peptidase (prepilin peptidase)/N-methyltransferase